MTSRSTVVAALAAVTLTILGAGSARAGGDWSSAERAVDDFQRDYEDLRKLTPQETRKIVTAICQAREQRRREVGRDASSRVQSTVRSKFSYLERKRDEALKKLDEVLKDSKLKNRHSDARSKRDQVKDYWRRIKTMTRSVRGANHPVVAFMLREGQNAHNSRQGSSSYCTQKEFSMNSGRADCVYASSCMVIELKPDNSNAISKGKSQASRYARELNTRASTLKDLINKNSAFKSCQKQKFRYRVDCYKLCPDIDSSTNQYRSTSVSWRTDC